VPVTVAWLMGAKVQVELQSFFGQRAARVELRHTVVGLRTGLGRNSTTSRAFPFHGQARAQTARRQRPHQESAARRPAPLSSTRASPHGGLLVPALPRGHLTRALPLR